MFFLQLTILKIDERSFTDRNGGFIRGSVAAHFWAMKLIKIRSNRLQTGLTSVDESVELLPIN